jgi:hypothetical protein
MTTINTTNSNIKIIRVIGRAIFLKNKKINIIEKSTFII